MKNLISEKIIEDILTSDKTILAELLSVPNSNLSLVARQKITDSGKLDMLYLCNNELLLIELKAVPFDRKIISQINKYHIDLINLQKNNKLINVKIQKVIIVTNASENDFKLCQRNKIKLLIYEPKEVLAKYYNIFKERLSFLNLQSGDFGVVRLGLLNNTLKLLGDGLSIKEVAQIENRAIKTIKNRISVAQLLNLVGKFKRVYYLTELGTRFVELRYNIVDDTLCQEQILLLSNFLKENPFYSSITYTIFSLIETVFVLSKNLYPVPTEQVIDYFVKSVGKTETWNAKKSKETATYIFSNFACELNFLVKVNNNFYITPEGIQAILLLQLNRAIKLIKEN